MDSATSIQPPLPAPRRSEPHRVLTWGAASCGVLSLLLIAADIGPAAFALGMAIAVVPVPVYVVLALWRCSWR